MRLTLVDDKKLKTIIRNTEDIAMKLSEIQASLNEIKAKQAEGIREIMTKLDALEAFLDSDPAAAMATLAEIREQAQRLADIVPNE